MKTYRYEIRVAPGYHGVTARNPIVSRTNSRETALRKVARNDRLYALDTETGTTMSLPRMDSPALGAGRYGAACRVSDVVED